MNLRENDIICGNGKISCNEVEILEICDFEFRCSSKII